LFWNRNKQKKVSASVESKETQVLPTVEPTVNFDKVYDLLKKRADLEQFLEQKGFFIKQKNDSGQLMSENFAIWQIGAMGKLIRQNILRWWMDNVSRLKNVVTLEEINNDKNIYRNYPVYAAQNNMKIPFGISRVKKTSREYFKSRDFTFSNDESRQFYLEFFVKAESSRDWLESWKNYMLNMLYKVGLLEEKLLCTYETPATATHQSGGYYFERYNFKFAYPFGYEDILHISNRIDFDFQSITDVNVSENLKIKEDKKSAFPHLIEIKLDVEKMVLAIILNRFVCARYGNKKNVSIVFSPLISPIKCVVFAAGISDEINKTAAKLHQILNEKYKSVLENRGEIGKTINHYRQFGVPYIVMVDDRSVREDIFRIFDCESEEWQELSMQQIYEYVKNGVGI